MQDKKSHRGNLRDNETKADTVRPDFRDASAALDFEERIEMNIQKRALEHFKKDDDNFGIFRRYDY